jgi:hypothetical protein
MGMNFLPKLVRQMPYVSSAASPTLHKSSSSSRGVTFLPTRLLTFVATASSVDQLLDVPHAASARPSSLSIDASVLSFVDTGNASAKVGSDLLGQAAALIATAESSAARCP